MPAQPLHCNHCEGVFLPSSNQPWSAVQCPHCSAQMRAGDCRAATAVRAVQQEYRRVTEQEETALEQQAKQRKWSGRLVFAACAVPLAVLLALGVQKFLRDHDKETLTASGESDGALAEQERKEMQATVQQFLNARTWQDMLPNVADANRVRSMMAWYFQRHPHQPVPGEVEIKSRVPLGNQGRDTRRLLAGTQEGAAIWLLLSREADGWKVDWEVFANAGVERWKAFLHEPSGSAVELPLMLALKPAADAYILKAGGAPDTHSALVLWALERASMAGTVLENESPQWKSLPEIGFEKAVKVIVRVTMLNPEAEPPLVRVDQILQQGWLR